MLFFFKQKTAYEMRISDWSSDVCSSDLQAEDHRVEIATLVSQAVFVAQWSLLIGHARQYDQHFRPLSDKAGITLGMGMTEKQGEIGRASCRESVCQYV